MSNPWRYDGKRVVVTGCASGMGEATARAAGELGAEVIGIDIHEASVPPKTFIQTDMADPASIDAAVERIGEPVHALFNCAGLSGGAAPAIPVMRVNFIGTRYLTEALIPRMQSGSAIASVSSLGGQGYEQNMPAIREFLEITDWQQAEAWCEEHPEQFTAGGYGFSKQCLIVYSMLRSVDLAARGIRINTIGPGVTDTPMLVDSRKLVDLDAMPKPLGRMATPTEQANVLLFLNGDAASYVSGVNIWTDGAFSAGVFTGQIAPRPPR